MKGNLILVDVSLVHVEDLINALRILHYEDVGIIRVRPGSLPKGKPIVVLGYIPSLFMRFVMWFGRVFKLDATPEKAGTK
jgi:hypothetical protein